MPKGYDVHQERMAQLQALGRQLARRSGRCCELCGEKGVSLRPFEVPPLPPQPHLEGCAFLCDRCLEGAGGGKISREWRFLETSTWSEVPPVQVTAVRLLGRLAREGVSWALETRENLYLSPEVEEWLEKE